MSAIFGIYNLDGKPVEPYRLEEMSTILAHRGSDNSGIWCEGTVGFGHRMLWTTPESLREQVPNSIQNGNLVITADARIDNRDELLAYFGLNRYAGDSSISDSELILLAYEKWGEGCTAKLLGDFAFAIWDTNTKTVFCGRDHFGVKSLTYHLSEDRFIFATEIKALWSCMQTPRVLNEVKISDHLDGTFDDVSSTFFKEVYKLPASHQLVVGQSGKTLRRYWSPDAQNSLSLSSNEAYADKFREIFTDSVRCRMRSAFTVGSMLSGGLDSSSIACTAQSIASNEGMGDLPTFSAVFDSVRRSDEQVFINAAIAQGGMDSHLFRADEVSPLANWERICWHHDEPLYSFNLYLNWGIYELAQKRGVRILLDGFDGDTTVSHGTVYLDELAIRKEWIALAKQLRGYGKNTKDSPSRLMWSYFHRHQLKPFIDKRPALKFAKGRGKSVLNRTLRGAGRSLSMFSLDHILNPDFVDRIDLKGRRRYLRDVNGKSPKTEKEDHLKKLKWGVMQYIVEVLGVSASAFGIEVRFPFWDKRLVDFCLSIPADQKIQGGWTRFVLRNAMSGVLPKSIQWRPDKGNPGYAFRQGFLNFEDERIRSLFANVSGKINEYVDIRALQKLSVFLRPGQTPTDDEVMAIWKVTTLSAWLENTEFAGCGRG